MEKKRAKRDAQAQATAEIDEGAGRWEQVGTKISAKRKRRIERISEGGAWSSKGGLSDKHKMEEKANR